MVAHIKTVAFLGVDAVAVDVQVHLAPGHNAFTVVGLPDKSVAESRERVRAALSAMGLALPYERITINLSPADLPKEGSHYDLPIALGLLAAMGRLTHEQVAPFVVMGELALDGRVCLGPCPQPWRWKKLRFNPCRRRGHCTDRPGMCGSLNRQSFARHAFISRRSCL